MQRAIEENNEAEVLHRIIYWKKSNLFIGPE